MPDFLRRLFSSDGFMPHGHCYLRNPALVWLHVISDGLIALAYTTIPFTLVYLVRKRRDIPFNWMLVCFGTFIIACGASHVMEIWTLWTPIYWLSGVIKAITAVASVSTAALLVLLVPKALAIPTSQELARAHQDLRSAHAALESRVQERTLDLTRKNERLAAEIGERERAEAALRVSEARYRRLSESGIIGIVTADMDGRLLDANETFVRMVGYSREDLGSMRLRDITPPEWRNRDLRSARQLRETGTATAWEKEYFRKDGTRISALVGAATLDESGSACVAFALDLTEQRRAEATVRRLREELEADTAVRVLADRLTSAVESVQDAFALFDREDRLVLCNSVYRSLVGNSLRGSIVGKTYEELFYAWVRDIAFSDDAERSRFRSERLERRFEPTTTYDVRMRDGRSLRVVDRRTSEDGIVTTIGDVTEDVRVAEELREARVAADTANAAKSDFLSSMSHELRTPLNAILGFAQLLHRDKKEPLSDRHRERLVQILRGGEHLLRLIDDILDLSRIEAGGISLSVEPVSVVEVLEGVMTTLEPMAAAQGIRVDLECIPPEPEMVAADRTRLAQILMNFGSNGVKYNQPGGKVMFTVLKPKPGYVRVAVRDTGLGIPLDKQDKLFQPFQRAGQEAGPIQGTGIGLVITRRLARLMGGDVHFRSVPGEGSEFWVDIPVHESRSRSSAPPPMPSAGRGLRVTDGHGLILYVEDNPANVTFMKDLVGTFENVELLTASTAEVGIELARDRKPRVVILDINLPGASGIEALRALRSAPETKRIPVIALTAAASERDKQRGTQAGFDHYLTKPVKVDELVTTLEGYFATAT